MLPQTERFNVEVEASNEAEIFELQMQQRTARLVRYGISAAAILLKFSFWSLSFISHSNFFQV
ncbi:hypothetical protein VXQ18_08515 [Brucella abortus]|nr:hypothetical protein [Brucella abortus]